MGKPVVGIFAQYSERDGRLMIGRDYFDALERAGAIPVLLPLFSDVADVEEILGKFDGFLFPGGPDVNPLLYGEETSAECGNIQPALDKL